MILILCILIFFICWLTMIIFLIISSVNKIRLRHLLDKQYPEINHWLTIRRANLQTLTSGMKPTLINFIMFWSYKVRRNYMNHFVDISAIESLTDKKPKRIVKRLIFLSSFGLFMWWILIIDFIIAVLTLNQL